MTDAEWEAFREALDDPRPVRPFVSLDDAQADRSERGRVTLFDLHGLWWSVPKELTLWMIEDQVAAELERMDLRPFAGDPVKPHQGTVA